MDVVLDKLCRSFGPREVVRQLSFEVPSGQLFGFLGPNGSGKSTTIKMLTTLLPPTTGDATIGGASIRQLRAVRERIAVVFQDPSLDTRLSALENLVLYGALYRPTWSRSERHERAMAALEAMGLADRATEQARTYSWGMRRRVEIARALLTEPGVLFLDEPTTGLDPQTRASLWEHLAALQQRTRLTLFLATHDMEEAERCERIAVLHHGRLQALDSPTGLCEATETDTLTQAFLALTSREITDDEVEGPLIIKGRDSALFRRG